MLPQKFQFDIESVMIISANTRRKLQVIFYLIPAIDMIVAAVIAPIVYTVGISRLIRLESVISISIHRFWLEAESFACQSRLDYQLLAQNHLALYYFCRERIGFVLKNEMRVTLPLRFRKKFSLINVSYVKLYRVLFA